MFARPNVTRGRYISNISKLSLYIGNVCFINCLNNIKVFLVIRNFEIPYKDKASTFTRRPAARRLNKASLFCKVFLFRMLHLAPSAIPEDSKISQ